MYTAALLSAQRQRAGCKVNKDAKQFNLFRGVCLVDTLDTLEGIAIFLFITPFLRALMFKILSFSLYLIALALMYLLLGVVSLTHGTKTEVIEQNSQKFIGKGVTT